MTYRTLSRTILTGALLGMAVASSIVTIPFPTEASEEAVSVQTGRYGPFATMRRANEIAEYFRSRGYNAHAYPEWGAYYVNVW